MMENYKILTIVIPTYNMEVYLRRCLDSLVISDKELFDKLEVLVINDGSKDSSSMIAHEYEATYPNTFRVIDKENGNYGSCINRGIDEASGLFFKILDADDWYNTEGLMHLLNVLQTYQNETDAAFTEFTYHDARNDSIRKYQYQTIEYGRRYDMNDIPLAGTKDECMLKMYSLAIKTAILRLIRLRLDTGISYTDNEFMYFLYPYINVALFFNIDVYQYFIGREGQTVSHESVIRHINDMFVVTKRMLDDYKQSKGNTSLMKRDCQEYHIVHCGLICYDTLLGMAYNKDFETKLKALYQDIKQVKSIRKKMLKSSPFFALWGFTGLYKSNRFIKPIWKLIRHS